MASLRRVVASDYVLGQPISENGKVFSCKSNASKTPLVVKQYVLSSRHAKEVIDEADQCKIKLEVFGASFPDRYWEDKGHVYFVQERLKSSMEEVIQEHQRKGSYITMMQMKNYVGEFTQILRKVHNKRQPNDKNDKAAHCRLKPSNLFVTIGEDGGEEFMFSDFYPFSNDNLDEYMSPEMVSAVIKNKSQRFAANQSLADLVGGDPQKLDVWQLGICLMQMATLKSAKQLLILRDQTSGNSVQAVELKELCRKLYGKHFNNLLEAMLQKNVVQRKRIQDLDGIVEDFLQDNDIDHSGIEIKPDTEAIMKAFSGRVQQKGQSMTQFLNKYELQASGKIKTSNLYDAMEDLGLTLSAKEKAALDQQHDPGKNGLMDMSMLVQQQQSQIKLGQLTYIQEQSLKDLLKEMNEYLVEQGVNILDLLRQKDTNGLGYLVESVFNDVLSEHNVGLQNEDKELVMAKFDPEKKGVVYYVPFCGDLQGVGNSQFGIGDTKKQIYKKIREVHTTFIQFFRLYDKKQQSFLSYKDVAAFLDDSKIRPAPVVMKALMNALDPDNKQEVLFSTFRNYFQDLVEEDIRGGLSSIAFALNDIKMSFGQLIRSNTKSASIITQQQLFDALKNIQVQIRRPDFNFILNYFQADKKEEISYVEFIEAVQHAATKLKVSHCESYYDGKQQQQPAVHQFSSFDDPDMQTINKSLTFNVKNFESQRNLLAAIFKQLEIRQVNPQSYFRGHNSRMSRAEYKQKIRELEIQSTDYSEEQEDLLLNITVTTDRGNIDTELLVEAILYYKVKANDKIDVQMHLVVQFFSILNKAMMQFQFTLDEFVEMDTLGDGTLRKKPFERVLTEQLQLNLNSSAYKAFYRWVQESETNINLQKLRIGLQLDQLSERMLQDIIAEIAYDKMKPEQVFRKYDANKNQKLELREVQELVTQLISKPDLKVVEILFYKIDSNGDKTISFAEFMSKINTQATTDSNQLSTGKYKYKPTVQSGNTMSPSVIRGALQLRIAMNEHALTIDAFDKKKRGIFIINAFQDVITNDLQLDYAEFRQLAKFLGTEDPQYLSTPKLQALFDDCEEAELLIITLNGQVSGGRVALMQLFQEYDENGNDKLEMAEFQKLIKDIDPRARSKPTETLFYLFDTNLDGSISVQELKQRLIQKEKPTLANTTTQRVSLMDELIRFIKQSPSLRQALEEQDEQYSNKLSTEQIAQVIKKVYGPPANANDIKELAEQMQTLQGNQVNYKLLVKKCTDLQQVQAQSKIDVVLTKLKEDLEYKGLSVVSMGKALDLSEKGRCKANLLKVELLDKKIKINDNEWELILTVIEMDMQNTVDYVAMNDLIQKGFTKFKEQKKTVTLNTNQEIDRIVQLISDFMEANSCTLWHFFKRTDSNSDAVLSQEEFMVMLQRSVEYTTTQDVQNQLFNIFDMDKDGKINYIEFEFQVYKRCELTYAQIEEMKSVLLGGRNIQIDSQIFELFNLISQQQQFINFTQLVTYMKKLKLYKILEYDQFFRHFDKDKLEQVDFYTFQSQIGRQHQETMPKVKTQVSQQQPDYGQPIYQQQQLDQSQYQQQQNQSNNLQYQQHQQYPGQQQPQSQYQPQQYLQSQYQPQQQTQQYQGQVQSQNQQQQQSQYQNQQYPPQLQSQQQQPPQFKESIDQSYQQQQQYQQQAYQPPPTHNTPQSQFQSQSHYPPQQQLNVPPTNASLANPMASAAIPRDFDRLFYESQLRKQCAVMNVDLFDLLCQYDRTPLPDLVVGNAQDLERVFLFLDIKAPTAHIAQFFYYYSHGGEQMSISELYALLFDPGKLIAKALNFTLSRHKDYTVDGLWKIIGKQSNFWTMDQFNIINQNLKLNLTNQELQQAIQFWDLQQQGKVTYKNYVEVLTMTQIQLPQKQQPGAPGINSQRKVLDEFLMHLSEVVHSKNCFNLYEKLDRKQVNEISVGEFEKTSRTLISDIQAQEIQAIRSLLSKDGMVNLSDLAKALNIDRNKQKDYNPEEEKKQYGIARQQGPKQPTLVASLQDKFKQIVLVLNDTCKKKNKNYDDLAVYFFPPNQNSTLDKFQFSKKCMDGTLGLSVQQTEDLYDYLDANQSGSITINEFRLVFQSKANKENKDNVKVAENIVMGKEIEDEIKELFNQIDENKNQSLDQRELHKALCSVGLNPSVEELAQYFQQFDKDNSGTISYLEFSIIVKDILKKELLQADDLLDELRKEFRQVCNPTTRMLSKEQVSQVFLNLGVKIKQEELDELFVEIDEDKSGTVDIDEFIYFIQKNQSGMSAKASAAIMNIKGSRRISLHDLKEIFLALPNNFIMSFIRNQNKKLLNLPSSSLKPQLDSCGLFYQDVPYVAASTFNIRNSILDKEGVKNNLVAEFRLLEATGVPIPDEKDVPRNGFLRREVAMLLIDKSRNRFEGNAAYLPANWQPNYEDRWIFDAPQIEETANLKWGNYDEKMDNMVELVFELITYCVIKGKLVQISCSYGSLPLNQLKPGKVYVDLKGGAPMKEITIDKKDIRTNRTGWRSVVKTLSSNIKSQLLIECYKVNVTQLQKISALPNRCILNKWAVGMQAGYREYYAYRTMMKGEIDLGLASDIRIKAWLNCIDCPDTYKIIAAFWQESIEPKSNDHQFLLKATQAIADSLYLMFKNSDFKYSQGDPTARVDQDNVLLKRRQAIVGDTVMEIKTALGLLTALQQQQQKKVNNVQASLEPLNLEEMMDLDNEADIAAMEKFFNKRKQKNVQQQQNPNKAN